MKQPRGSLSFRSNNTDASIGCFIDLPRCTLSSAHFQLQRTGEFGDRKIECRKMPS